MSEEDGSEDNDFAILHDQDGVHILLDDRRAERCIQGKGRLGIARVGRAKRGPHENDAVHRCAMSLAVATKAPPFNNSMA